MSTRFPELFRELTRPFPQQEVKILRKAGRDFRYVTARTLMIRLDSVLGPENWSVRYTNLANVTECQISITLPDGTCVTKCDAGGSANMSDEGDDEKSSYSDAFKRTCMCWGVGRELWGDGNTSYRVDPSSQAPPPPKATPEPERYDTGPKEDIKDYARVPADESRSSPSPPSEPTTRQTTIDRGRNGNFDTERLPTTGKSCWAWVKGLEEKYKDEPWSKSLGFKAMARTKELGAPDDLVDWSQADVANFIGYVSEIRSLKPEDLKHREEQAKRRAQLKKKGILFDSLGVRISPLTLDEKSKKDETGETELALERIARHVNQTPIEVAKAVVGAMWESHAPYMEHVDRTAWNNLLPCVTLLRFWWPDRFKTAVRTWVELLPK